MKFICESKDLTLGLINVKQVMNMSKRFKEFLLHIEPNQVQIRYHDGTYAYVHTMSAVTEFTGDYLVDYTKFFTLLSTTAVQGDLGVRPLTIEINESNTLIMTVTKVIKAKDTQDEEVVSHMKYTMQVLSPTISLKFACFTQISYSDLFTKASYDVWEIEQFKALVNKLNDTTGDALIYLTGEDMCARSKHLTYSAFAYAPYIDANPVVFSSPNAKLVLGILSKYPSNEMHVQNINNKSMLVTSADNSSLLMLPMPNGDVLDKKAFELFQMVTIQDITLKVHKNALLNALKSLKTTTTCEKYELSIKKLDSGKCILTIQGKNSNDAILAQSMVLIADLKANADIDALQYTALISIDTFLNILRHTNSTHINLILNMKENRMFKLEDLSLADTDCEQCAATYFGVLEVNE